MSEDLKIQLAMLQQLRERGLLSEETYEAEESRLRETAGYEAQTDSGAIAQGPGAVAAASRGVHVGGSVGESIVTGDHNVVGNVYVGEPTDDPQEALRIYRRVLVHNSANLPLRGVDVGASDPNTARQLGLANVYVDLDTTSKFVMDADIDDDILQAFGASSDDDDPKITALPARRVEDRPLSALEATIDNRWLVLTGDPGGGKSTFVNHLAFCLSAHVLEPGAGWLDHLHSWPEEERDLLPLVFILRDFAASIDGKQSGPATPSDFWQFFVASLEDKNLGFAARAIERELENGRAIIFLDGLDEVPGTRRRLFVRDAVKVFADRYPGNRFLVTCRILSYQPPDPKDEEDPDLRLDEEEFPKFEIARFDEAKIERFIEAWYAELARIGSVPSRDIPRLTERLKEAVRRPDLWRLATNPLLLTVMSLVHAHDGGRLPDARALLYERTVDMLLWRWEEVKTSGGMQAPTLRQLLQEAGRADLDLKRLLWRLAYEAHGRSPDDDEEEGLGDIRQAQLTDALERLKREDWGWAHAMMNVMKLRAGILVERLPGVFTFPHRTFQEYLAGAHLSTEKEYSKEAAKLGGQGALWREPILLAAGRLVHVAGDVEKALNIVNRLCPAQEPAAESGWRTAWLAADALLEIGLRRVQDDDWGGDLLARMQQRLVRLITGGYLAPRERAAAGLTLAELGDPRVEVMEVDQMQFCAIPKGMFWMGSADEDGDAADDEKPQHQVDIPYDYWIGRYPVSNAQFATFVEEDGYLIAAYWPEARATGYWRPDKGFYVSDSNFRRSPYDWGLPFIMSNHPVVGVSWYEALAFTRWLTDRWRNSVLLPGGLAVKLPGEAEWEKAARGGLRIPARAASITAGQWALFGELVDNPFPKRQFPWGDGFNAELANSTESGIDTTNALGVFAGQRNPYGVEEMSGNVWEWTRGQFGAYPYDAHDGRETPEDFNGSQGIVLLGGSFRHESGWSRCGARWADSPNFPFDHYGFRVVLSPIDSGR